jgi:hypothetical protein
MKKEVSVVQALMINDDAPAFATRTKYSNRILAEHTSLIPYQGKDKDDVSTWCPKLLKRYQEQRRRIQSSPLTFSAKEEWTTFYFLQRILQHVQQQQKQQQQQQEEEEVSLESEVDDTRNEEDKQQDSTNRDCPGDDHKITKCFSKEGPMWRCRHAQDVIGRSSAVFDCWIMSDLPVFF